MKSVHLVAGTMPLHGLFT